MWGYGLLSHHYEKMHKEDQEYVATRKARREAEAASEPAENPSLQSFAPGDAKKGAGLFKVGYISHIGPAAESLTSGRHDVRSATLPLNLRATRSVLTYTVCSAARPVK
jgi:hypothetical protein